MKIIAIFFLVVLCHCGSFAQNDVELRIYHRMGNDQYAWNTAFVNGFGESFKVTRLQYYVTRISLIHDGGQVTAISDDTVSLVKANGSYSSILLGALNVMNIEGVKFHIGVFSPVNNADPSLYPPGHPLAPQNPSMHWGWASGYRFLAYEGVAGNNYSQTFQLHALGNSNYHEQTLNLNAQSLNGMLILAVDADYVEALRNIPLANGVIAHGDDLEDKTAIENFRDFVFSERLDPLNLGIEEDAVAKLTLFPNPVDREVDRIQIHNHGGAPIDKIEVYDSQGRVQSVLWDQSKISNLASLSPGLYLVRIHFPGYVMSQSIMIK